MRIIGLNKHKAGELEVKWMWLPTFIGQNNHLLQMLDRALQVEFMPPLQATETKLDEINEFVINWLCKTLKISGLEIYLRSLEDVGEDVPSVRKNLFRELRQVFRGVKWGGVESIEVSGTVGKEVSLDEGPIAVTIIPTKDNEGDEGKRSSRKPMRLPDKFIELLGERRREELKDERVIHEMRNMATDAIEWFFIPEVEGE